MANQENDRAKYYYSEESSEAETPSSPTLTELRVISDSLDGPHNKATPRYLKGDRQKDGLRDLSRNAAGSIQFHICRDEWDPFIAATLGQASVSRTSDTATDVSVTAATRTIASVATDITAGLTAGSFIKTSGFTASADNDYWKVESVSGSGPYNVVVYDPDGDLVDEIAGQSVTISRKTIRNGTSKRSFLIEENWQDVSKFRYWKGMVPHAFRIDWPEEDFITGEIDLLGHEMIKPAASTIGDGSPNAASTEEVLEAGADIATVGGYGSAAAFMIAGLPGTAIGALQRATLEIVGNGAIRAVATSKTPDSIRRGTFDIRLTTRLYLATATLDVLDYFRENTAKALHLQLTNPSGAPIFISLPSARVVTAPVPNEGLNTDAMIDAVWEATEDATLGWTIGIDQP